jgi:hypothetical protein
MGNQEKIGATTKIGLPLSPSRRWRTGRFRCSGVRRYRLKIQGSEVEKYLLSSVLKRESCTIKPVFLTPDT